MCCWNVEIKEWLYKNARYLEPVIVRPKTLMCWDELHIDVLGYIDDSQKSDNERDQNHFQTKKNQLSNFTTRTIKAYVTEIS